MRAPRALGLVVVGASLVLAVGLQWWPSDVAISESRALPPFVFTALDEGPLDDITAFATELQANFPIIVAGAAAAELFGGIIGLPTTFIVDRDGHIVHTHVGYASADMLEDAVRNLLRDRGL